MLLPAPPWVVSLGGLTQEIRALRAVPAGERIQALRTAPRSVDGRLSQTMLAPRVISGHWVRLGNDASCMSGLPLAPLRGGVSRTAELGRCFTAVPRLKLLSCEAAPFLVLWLEAAGFSWGVCCRRLLGFLGCCLF